MIVGDKDKSNPTKSGIKAHLIGEINKHIANIELTLEKGKQAFKI